MDNKTIEELIEELEESTRLVLVCIQHNLHLKEMDAWQEELDDEFEMYNE